jgi:hypothetical protein
MENICLKCPTTIRNLLAALRADLSVRNPDAAENLMLPASREHRADCSVGRRWAHNVPDVVAHAADIERLKVVSPLDAADIGHRAEDRREQASTCDHGSR